MAGIIAGTVMLAPMFGMNMYMGIPADIPQTLIGLHLGFMQDTGIIVGSILHFVASASIGAIFGIVINTSKKFLISSYAKGLALGIATGAIAFAVLSIPVMTVIQPTMITVMQDMNPDLTKNQVISTLESMQPQMMLSSILSHIVYGAVLGIVASTILKRDYELYVHLHQHK